MDETLTTAGEPQVIESANTADVNTAGYMQVQGTDMNDGSQVIESSTPMDNNVTYNNVPNTEPSFDQGKDFTQNIVQRAVQLSNQTNLDANSGAAMDQFLNQDYDYDKSEAGTYWVAGAINDVDTQMSFLNTLIREDMYDEMDLQKYYYDTTMATARAYASQKKKETAYGFYRAAQEKAIAEAQLTGWYMPAEGNYMLGQYSVAQNVLEDPDAPDDAKARAKRISGTVEKWFNANQIGTRGIKCLNMMNYEENVRHNTIMGQLQAEANQIAGGGNAANAALNKLKLREFKFSVEELELQTGHNFSYEIGLDNKEDFLGHDWKNDYPKYGNLQGFAGDRTISIPKLDENGKQIIGADGKVEKEEVKVSALAAMLHDSPYYYSAILGNTNTDFVNRVLEDNGIDSRTMFVQYDNDQRLASNKAYLNSEEGKGATYIPENAGSFTGTGKTLNGHEIKTTVAENKVIAGYFEDGVFVPLTSKDKNKLLQDGKTSVNDFLTNAYGENNIDWSGTNAITIDGKTYSLGRPETSHNITSYTNMSSLGWEKTVVDNNKTNATPEKVKDAITKSETAEGYKDSDGNKVRNLKLMPELMEEKNWNQYIILQGEDDKGNKTYYAVTTDGKLQKKNESDVKEVGYVKDNLKVGDWMELSNDVFNGDNAKERIAKASYKVHYNKKEDKTIMALPRSDGTVEYYAVKGDVQDGYEYKITNINMTDDEVKALGGNILENKQSVNAKTSEYNTPKEDTKSKTTSSSSGSSSGGHSSGGSKNVELQNTVTDRKAVFEKYNITPLEQLQYETISNPKDLEEKIRQDRIYYGNFLGKEGK